MENEIYFVRIDGFRNKERIPEVIAWLEENVVLGHGEAQQVGSSLPFEIPMGYPSKSEAERFTKALLKLGCSLGFESLSERKRREAAAASAGRQSEQQPEEAVTEKKPDIRGEQGDEEESESSISLKDPKTIMLGVAGGVVLTVMAWLGSQWGGEEPLSPTVGDPEVNSALVEIQQDAGSAAPFSQVVGNMQRFIEKQNYSQEERREYSSGYFGGVEGVMPIKERQTRNRNIMMLRMSLAFYERNRDSWRRLIMEYQAIVANLKVKELRKEMVDIFGEEETEVILEGLFDDEEEEKEKKKGKK